MPPRLDLFSRLRIQDGNLLRSVPLIRPFTTTPTPSASTVAQKRRHQDPYALAQARARRAANLSRQEVLVAERSKASGDPVRGIQTPFLESFDTATLPVKPSSSSSSSPDTGPLALFTKQDFLNHFVTSTALRSSLRHSERLTAPIAPTTDTAASTDPQRVAEQVARHRRGHSNAAEALARIVSLENGSSADRTRANKQRCIEAFGRHNTDAFLRPKPKSTVGLVAGLKGARRVAEDRAIEEVIPGEVAIDPTTGATTEQTPLEAAHPGSAKTPRAGPDTGSSEVQIALLTVKIRALANFLDSPRGRKDKVNARNLRLMVHRRQKLLQYLRRKERGGERWRRVTEVLGLGEATWMGEISL